MLCHSRSENPTASGHDRWSNKIIQTFQSFLQQPGVYIVKQIVNVLHRELKAEGALKLKLRIRIEAIAFRSIPFSRHAETTQHSNYKNKTKSPCSIGSVADRGQQLEVITQRRAGGGGRHTSRERMSGQIFASRLLAAALIDDLQSPGHGSIIGEDFLKLQVVF